MLRVLAVAVQLVPVLVSNAGDRVTIAPLRGHIHHTIQHMPKAIEMLACGCQTSQHGIKIDVSLSKLSVKHQGSAY